MAKQSKRKNNSKPSVSTLIVSKPDAHRVQRRNVYARAHSLRGPAGSGFHGDKSKFSRKVKHTNRNEY